MALFIRAPSIPGIGILQPQQQRGVDRHEHGAAVVPQRAGDGIQNTQRRDRQAGLDVVLKDDALGMFSSLTSARNERIINALPNIMFVIIIDLNREVYNNQKSGFIRYRTNQIKLFGEDVWIAGRGKADRAFFGHLPNC